MSITNALCCAYSNSRMPVKVQEGEQEQARMAFSFDTSTLHVAPLHTNITCYAQWPCLSVVSTYKTEEARGQHEENEAAFCLSHEG